MAPHFRRILVPVDFSESSRRALEHALSLAEGSGASVDPASWTPRSPGSTTWLPW